MSQKPSSQRPIVASLLGAILLLPSVGGAQAAVEEGGTRVVATATRTARAAPDRVAVYAIIEGSAESAVEAAQRADRKLQAVLDAMRQHSARAEISTAVPYGVMPAPNYGGFPAQTASNPLVARYIIRVQPQRVEQLMSVATTLLTAGASAVTPPMFELSSLDSVRRAKFSEALSQARADAEAIATGLGMRLGSLIEVTSGGPAGGAQFGGAPLPYFTFSRGFDMSGPGQPPEVAIVSTVTVRYRLVAR